MSDFKGSRLVAKFVELCMERMEIINDALLKLVGDPENEAAITAMFSELEALKGESNMLNLMSFHEVVGHFEALMKWGEGEQFDVHPQFFELAFSGLEAVSQLVYAGIYDVSSELIEAAEHFATESEGWLENPLRPEPPEPPPPPPEPEPELEPTPSPASDPMRIRLMELFGALCEKRIGAVREYLVTLQSMPRLELVPLALREVESIRSEAQILGLTPISDVAAHIGMLMLWLSARHFQGPGQAFDGMTVGLDLLQELISAGFKDGLLQTTEDIEEYQQGVSEWLQENESVPIPEPPVWTAPDELPPQDEDTEEVMPEWVSAESPVETDRVFGTEEGAESDDEVVEGPFVVDWPMGFMKSPEPNEVSEHSPTDEPTEQLGAPQRTELAENSGGEVDEVVEIQFSEDGPRVESSMTEEMPLPQPTEERPQGQIESFEAWGVPPVVAFESEAPPSGLGLGPEGAESENDASELEPEVAELEPMAVDSGLAEDEEITFMAEAVAQTEPTPQEDPAYWSVAVEQLDDLTRLGGTLNVQQSQSDQGLQVLNRISGTWSRGLKTLRDAVGPQGDGESNERLSGVVEQLSGAQQALGLQLEKMADEAVMGRARLVDLQSEIQQIHGLEADAWFRKHPESRFAWDQLLLVEIAGGAYGLSVHRIDEVVEVSAEHILSDSVALPGEGKTLPLMDLSEVMRWPSSGRSTSGSMVLLNADNRCWALQVDRVIGQRKAVQQVANPILSGFPFVSGTAIVEEGRVVTCLGVKALIAVASEQRQRTGSDEAPQ